MISPTFCPYCTRWLEQEPANSTTKFFRCVPCNVRFSLRFQKVELREEMLTIDLVPVPYGELR